MPAARSPASDIATAVAPDGVAIHTFDLPAAKLVGVAQGRIPRGRFAIHRHLILEQYTYVLSGRVTAVTASDSRPGVHPIDLSAGDLLLTLPGESLQFINDSIESASVLFICAPPYPADDSDTCVLDDHSPPGAAEARAAIERLRGLRAELNVEVDSRIAALERLAQQPSREPSE